MPADAEIQRLRGEAYNAAVCGAIDVHEALRILRIRPDAGVPGFLPGQYTVLGLGNWERRVDAADEGPLTDAQRSGLTKRAYSFSCAMLDAGQVRRPGEFPFVEFYLTLVSAAGHHGPMLSPRLFALGLGDRLYFGSKVTGRYTLQRVGPEDDVVLVSTGTGEAPHNAMAAELLSRPHRGQVYNVTCVRRRSDLGYLATHRELERQFSNYRYVALTTREPENLDPRVPGYVGKRYLQGYVTSGDFERETGKRLDPRTTHVFLCGNPAMIGLPMGHGEDRHYPEPRGMVEILEHAGFEIDRPTKPGNLHVEAYW